MMERDAPGIAHNRRPTVQVEIPAPLAEALIEYGDELVEALRGYREARQQAEAQARRERMEADKATIARWVRHVWRFVRQHQADGESEKAAIQRLEPILRRTLPHPLGHQARWTDIHHLVSSHRRRVERYLEQRRAYYVGRRQAEGAKRATIAHELGYSPHTIDNLRRRQADTVTAGYQGAPRPGGPRA
jgi:hypothetical protein